LVFLNEKNHTLERNRGMTIYFGSVVLLYRGPKVTVERVVCGEGAEEEAAQYVAEHPVSGGVYEIQEVEADVYEHPPTWGMVGERT
jgi:hypothetical protein